MNPAPTLSVIIPVFNAARHIAATIESVLEQDYRDFEILLIDDCSTDESADRIRPYLSDRVFYQRESTNHGGPSAPRNRGMKLARGRYFLFFDADDLMLPGKLRDTVEALKANPDAGLLCTGFRSIDEAGTVIRQDYLAEYQEFRKHLVPAGAGARRLASPTAYRELLHANFVGTSSACVPRQVIEAMGAFDESLSNGDDYDMWLRIAYRYDVIFVDKVLHSYRVSMGSVSSRGSRNMDNRIRVLEKQRLNRLDPECARRVRHKLRLYYCQLGNAERRRGNVSAARRRLRQSMRNGLSLAALKGWAVTLLPPSVRRRLSSTSA